MSKATGDKGLFRGLWTLTSRQFSFFILNEQQMLQDVPHCPKDIDVAEMHSEKLLLIGLWVLEVL